jgi:hypothetical protein
MARRFFWCFPFSAALFLFAAQATNPIKLYPHPVAEVGYDAFGIVSADLNGDGLDDVVTANGDMEYAGVSVLIASEEGNFAPQVVYSTCEYPIMVIVGDFDGDERADLAASCPGYSSGGPDDVSILLGNGDGTFQTEMRFGTIDEPDAIAAGDFDGDDEQDLVILPWGSSLLSPDRASIAVGDFNNDNREDLAINGGGLAFHHGNGDGSFDPANTGIAPAAGIYLGNEIGGLTPGPPFAGSLDQVVVGYLDDDTNQDLVASVPPAGGLEIYFGNGDATFALAGTYLSGLEVNDIALGDFDGNGSSDIVAYADPDSYTRYLLFGDGNGGFTVSQQSEEYDQFLAVGHFDADGRLDIASLFFLSKVTFHYGNGDGTFPELFPNQASETTNTESADAPSGAKSFDSADFDGDGWSDFVWSADLVFVKLGNGDGRFTGVSCYGSCLLDGNRCRSNEDCTGLASFCAGVPVDPDCFEAGTAPVALATGDVDGDGRQDVVTANSGSNDVSVLPGNGDGSLAASVEYLVGNSPSDVAIGLFDSGSTPDLAVANAGSDDVSVLLGNGDGSFGTQTSFAAGTDPSSVAAGDLDRDGEMDLAVANRGSNNVSVLIGNGDGTFMDSVQYAVGPGPGDVAIGDLNRDGLSDLVVANEQYSADSVSVLLGIGGGLFAEEVRIPARRPSCVAIADVDFDGWQDLLICGPTPGLTMLMGNGDGTFGARQRFGAKEFTVADFDGNGRLDFSSGVSYLNMTNPTSFSVEPDKETLTWPKVDDAASYNMYRGYLDELVDGNGDGLPDLGYGVCKNDLDPSLVDRVFVDGELPVAGAGFFYLMSYVDDFSVELGLGTASDGTPRNVVSPCP